MGCPHGNGPPERCSQCLGAIARRVSIIDGQLLIDGSLRGSAAAHAAQTEDAMTRKPANRRGGAAARSCSVCRQPGHNAKTCPRRA
jgi:hypothetical protein